MTGVQTCALPILPNITIQWFAGRTQDQKRQLTAAITEAMVKIAGEARSDPELLRTAPHKTPFGRLDEVQAAKALVLCCQPG